MEITPIAFIHNDFKEKFGIPKQAGLASRSESLVVMEPEFSVSEAFRGLEEFGRIWLIWEFSSFSDKEWSPTIRPPVLGGNKRIGVFATRSPHRPNSLALSCVELSGIEKTISGQIALRVAGADLMDGTPIYDIKPYIPYADSFPEAKSGFSDGKGLKKLDVAFESEAATSISEEKLEELSEILSLDPRPRYQDDPERIYGMTYGKLNVKFRVSGKKLTVIEIE